MEIIDQKVLKYLECAQSPELEESLRSFPEDERDGRTDMQMLREEIDYLLDMYREPGTHQNKALKEAQAILRETKNGQSMPLLLPSLSPKYTHQEIEGSRAITNEYHRLANLNKQLAKQRY